MRRMIVLAGLIMAVTVPAAHAQVPYTDNHPPAVGGTDTGAPSAVLPLAGGGGVGTAPGGGAGNNAGNAALAGGNASAGGTRLQATAEGTRFALTGADITGLVAIGAGAIIVGVFLKRRARTA